MKWAILCTVGNGFNGTRASLAHCVHCGGESVWWSPKVQATFGMMVYPAATSAPPPHDDMPEDVRADYEEARQIAVVSPRAASALLRLSIEKLCAGLNAKGNNINERIGDLVAGGLPIGVQRALDAVRVIGNNAVHPGKMDRADVGAVCNTLFALVNLIVEDRITSPKMVDDVFSSLPSGARDAIERRDAGEGKQAE